ncbi:unnamed protein product [Protopolystoma xenopodis]|uniref:Uncharacterized protein n=1 Tax=Protopolystoma xenopodis TaxID=117903 RepID=A0A3S5ACB2_9PLAT|nr:unnamed protein product [Protopolystoma xenopodis]
MCPGLASPPGLAIADKQNSSSPLSTALRVGLNDSNYKIGDILQFLGVGYLIRCLQPGLAALWFLPSPLNGSHFIAGRKNVFTCSLRQAK